MPELPTRSRNRPLAASEILDILDRYASGDDEAKVALTRDQQSHEIYGIAVRSDSNGWGGTGVQVLGPHSNKPVHWSDQDGTPLWQDAPNTHEQGPATYYSAWTTEGEARRLAARQ